MQLGTGVVRDFAMRCADFWWWIRFVSYSDSILQWLCNPYLVLFNFSVCGLLLFSLFLIQPIFDWTCPSSVEAQNTDSQINSFFFLPITLNEYEWKLYVFHHPVVCLTSQMNLHMDFNESDLSGAVCLLIWKACSEFLGVFTQRYCTPWHPLTTAFRNSSYVY